MISSVFYSHVARCGLKLVLSSFLTNSLRIIIHNPSVALPCCELLTASSNTSEVKQLDCWSSYLLGDEFSFDYPVKNDQLQHVRDLYQFYLEHQIFYPLLRRTRLIASNWASVNSVNVLCRCSLMLRFQRIHLLAAASELHFSPISFLQLWKKEPYVIVYLTVETTWNAVENVDIFISDKDRLTRARNIKSCFLSYVSLDPTYIWLASSNQKWARLLTSFRSQKLTAYIKLRRLWLYDAELYFKLAHGIGILQRIHETTIFFLQKCPLKRWFLQCMCVMEFDARQRRELHASI